MAGLQIPLKSGSSAFAVAYDTAVDGAYSVYNATLKNYPVTNAFVDGADTSQEKWGLQITSRATQNTEWKAQLTYGVASGTGAFAMNSITYPFTKTISKFESGNIQFNMYQANAYSIITFDEINNRIGNVRSGGAATIISGTQKSKGYIATSTNDFLAVCDGTVVKTYSVDVNGVITNSMAASTATMATVDRSWVIAAKGQYIWVVGIKQALGLNPTYNRFYGQLYSIDSSGILSTVGAATTIYLPADGAVLATGTTIYSGCGSYIKNNVAHLIMSGHNICAGNSGSNTTARLYNTVDLATVTVFTTTPVKQEAVNGAANDYFGTTVSGADYTVGYDGAFGLIVTNLGTAGTPDVYKVNAAGGFVDSTVNYFEGYLNVSRYRNSTTKLSTAATNTFVSGTNTLKINNVAITGTLTNLHLNSIWVYKMTGTNEEDDTSAFIGMNIKTTAIGSGSGNITLKANGTLIKTITSNHIALTASYFNMIFTTPIAIASTKINFLLEFANTLGVDYKIGYGLNGGTYDSPTGNYETSTINLLLQ